MKQPLKICLLTPSLQQGRYVERAVRSVLCQQGESFTLEYIVRDAESNDGTALVLKTLQEEFAQHPGFTVRIASDDGQAAVLAEEFSHTDADILGWLNADDVLLPGALQKIAEVFTRDSPDVVYGDAWFIDASDKVIGRYPVSRHSVEHLRTTCYLSQPSVFFSRELYNRVGGIRRDLHYAMDYDLWLRFAHAGAKFEKIDAVLSATRLHTGTKTDTGGVAFVDEIINVQQAIFGDVPEQWRLYRKYREWEEKHPTLPAACSYTLALTGYVFRNPLQFVRLGLWSGRIAWTMLVARVKAGKMAGKSLKH